jgi:hypothetical protein
MTAARHFPKGKNDPAFRTKLAIGADLAVRAQDAGFAFRAVVAESAYGDQDGDLGLRPGCAHHGRCGPRPGLGRAPTIPTTGTR